MIGQSIPVAFQEVAKSNDAGNQVSNKFVVRGCIERRSRYLRKRWQAYRDFDKTIWLHRTENSYRRRLEQSRICFLRFSHQESGKMLGPREIIPGSAQPWITESWSEVPLGVREALLEVFYVR